MEHGYDADAEEEERLEIEEEEVELDEEDKLNNLINTIGLIAREGEFANTGASVDNFARAIVDEIDEVNEGDDTRLPDNWRIMVRDAINRQFVANSDAEAAIFFLSDDIQAHNPHFEQENDEELEMQDEGDNGGGENREV
jgi:hypothetical protein